MISDVINQMNPPIIRFLTLAAPRGIELFGNNTSEKYIPSTDLDIAKEIKYFIENLKGITSYIESNNILNLLQEIEGKMPDAKEKIRSALDEFIHLPDEHRVVFQVGKRLRLLSGLSDLNNSSRFNAAKDVCLKNGITLNNADKMISEMIQSYLS